MKTLWLIPARGGSKGIPGKNIKPFCGESLVSRAINQALACSSPQDEIFVSTDSEEIKAEAERCGVTMPWLRPEHLATDTASTHSVIIHTLEQFLEQGTRFDRVILLQPTSPFRTTEDIMRAIDLWGPDIDMTVSVTRSKANPYYNLFEINKKGYLEISKGKGGLTRRQDAPAVWEYNGAVYVITVDSVLKGEMSKFKKVIPYEMPESRSFDLDTPQDWEIAELIFERLNKN